MILRNRNAVFTQGFQNIMIRYLSITMHDGTAFGTGGTNEVSVPANDANRLKRKPCTGATQPNSNQLECGEILVSRKRGTLHGSHLSRRDKRTKRHI